MAELISANFKGFEIEFDNTGAIYLNSELLVPENGIVKLSVEDKSVNLIVADFFIEKFGVEQLGSFFDVSVASFDAFSSASFLNPILFKNASFFPGITRW